MMHKMRDFLIDVHILTHRIAVLETNTAKIIRRLENEGWYLARHGSGHDIYKNPVIDGIITVPRHRTVSPGVADSIAIKAGWRE